MKRNKEKNKSDSQNSKSKDSFNSFSEDGDTVVKLKESRKVKQ